MELTPLQNRLLLMFKWFHLLCEENNIRYYALGGTMLGAARHQGFIPWDDDIDVGLPRKDYEKLRSIAANMCNEQFMFEFPDSEDELFATPYAKLYDTTTTLIENYRKPLKRGIFIDIFPLDGTGNDEKSSMAEFKKIKKKYNLFMTRVAAVNPRRAFIKNAAIMLSGIIPEKLCSNRSLRINMDRLAKTVDFDTSKFGGNVFGQWGYKEIFETSVMGVPTEYKFNGITIFGAENFDEYLTKLYGDWRKLPPKEEQVTHHDFLKLDLDNAYSH